MVGAQPHPPQEVDLELPLHLPEIRRPHEGVPRCYRGFVASVLSTHGVPFIVSRHCPNACLVWMPRQEDIVPAQPRELDERCEASEQPQADAPRAASPTAPRHR